MRKPDNQNYRKYRFLAKTTTRNKSISIAYIVKSIEKAKRANPQNGFTLFLKKYYNIVKIGLLIASTVIQTLH